MAAAAVTAIAGNRIFGSGNATQGASQPYVVWQVITTAPANTLACLPDSDDIRIQVDCYASGQSGENIARQLATAVRNALEEHAYMLMAWNDFEKETSLFRWSMDFGWILSR
jgi:hypothetical protein